MLNFTKSPTLRQMQIFSALVETNSVSRVAEKLHISQPSVSIQLKNLSEQLNTELYVVNNRKVHTTEAGYAVYQATLGIANTFEDLHIRLDAFNGLNAGKLKIAVVSTAQYFMPKLLSAFCRKYPNIDVQLTINNRQTVLKRFMENMDDFYVLSHWPEDLDAEKIPFVDNELVVMANDTHELTRQPHISLNRLQHYPFIMREKGSGTRMSIDMFCQKHNLTFKERMTIESNGAIKLFVAEGLGLAILSRSTLDHSNIPGLTTLDVEQFPIINKWFLVRKTGRSLSLLAETFETFAKRNVKRLLSGSR